MVQWLRLQAINAVGLGSIPGQGTIVHMLQLKIPHDTTRSQCSQIDENLTINIKKHSFSYQARRETRRVR